MARHTSIGLALLLSCWQQPIAMVQSTGKVISEISGMTDEGLRRIIAAADVDRDGKLSKAELLSLADKQRTAMERESAAELPTYYDSNEDGILTEEEMLNFIMEWDMEFEQELQRIRELEKEKFRISDFNGDRKLEGEEVIAMMGHGLHDGVLEAVARSALKTKDLNKDGTLSAEEFWYDYLRPDEEPEEDDRDKEATFAQLDRDGNSQVNLSELKAWESGRFFLEESIDKIWEFADYDEDTLASLEELEKAWPLVDETGVALRLAGILDRTRQDVGTKKDEL